MTSTARRTIETFPRYTERCEIRLKEQVIAQGAHVRRQPYVGPREQLAVGSKGGRGARGGEGGRGGGEAGAGGGACKGRDEGDGQDENNEAGDDGGRLARTAHDLLTLVKVVRLVNRALVARALSCVHTHRYIFLLINQSI